MPWYYIEVSHGGGHQSTTSKWAWRDKPTPIKTDRDIENFIDGEFDGVYFGGDSAIFNVKRVNKLPAMVHDRLEQGCLAQIERATKLLLVLSNTQKHPIQCPYEVSRWHKDPKLRHIKARCHLAEGHRGKHTCAGRLNREKFGR